MTWNFGRKRSVSGLERRLITLSQHGSYVLARQFRNRIPVVLVTGYPKSGTTWVSQLVADYLCLPFIDLTYFPVGCPCVMHGHYRVTKGGPRTVYVVRDGRDAVVSLYFYSLRSFGPDECPARNRRYRHHFPQDARCRELTEAPRAHLPQFIEAEMKHPAVSASWGAHVRSYLDCSVRQDLSLVKYEDLLRDTPDTLGRAIAQLTGKELDEVAARTTAAKFAFEKQSGRQRGQEDTGSFLRKGQAGDWKNHFNRDAARRFDRFAGTELIALGYERTSNWITCVDE